MSITISLENIIFKAIESSFSNFRMGFKYPKKQSINNMNRSHLDVVHAENSFQFIGAPISYQFNLGDMDQGKLCALGSVFNNGINHIRLGNVNEIEKNVLDHLYSIIYSVCISNNTLLTDSVASFDLCSIKDLKAVSLFMNAIGLTDNGVAILEKEYIPEIKYVKHLIDQVDIDQLNTKGTLTSNFFGYISQFEYPLDVFIELDNMGFSVQQMMLFSKDEVKKMVRDYFLYSSSFSQLKEIKNSTSPQILKFTEGHEFNTGKLCKLLYELEAMGCHEKIYEIYLDNNAVQMLPEKIGKFTNLRVISLPNNSLKQLPNNLENLKSLEMLLVSNNKISFIPAVFNQLDKLHLVDIRENSINGIHQSVKSNGAIFCFNDHMMTGQELFDTFFEDDV